MAESGSLSLLDLSAELRLMVYGHLLVDSLASGCSTGLASLYRSCRTVYRELEREFIFKTRVLLDVQYEWKKGVDHSYMWPYEPIGLELSYKGLLSKTTDLDLTIALPLMLIESVSAAGHPQKTRYGTMGSAYTDLPLFERLVAHLTPIIRLPWSTLQISFSDNGNTPTNNLEFVLTICQAFFDALEALYQKGLGCFGRIGRLILSFGNACGYSYHECFGFLFIDLLINRTAGYPPFCFLPRPRHTWIARKQSDEASEREWRLVYDFEDKPGKIDGALWAIVVEDGFWKSKRLFTKIDGEVPAEFEKEIEFAVEEVKG
jgi:hypothetical protein